LNRGTGGVIVGKTMVPHPALSHVDASNRPQMVDVGGKPVTRRAAHAIARVILPAPLAAKLDGGDIASPKGPLFQAAILAGIMGAKKTAELIPLCHPLPLDDCRIEIKASPAAADGSVEVEVHCRTRAEARTGVEMEALTGASVAALTLYDMGKAAAPGIVIREIRLLEKTGGKSDYRAP
jgi:cyclic pyranopterin phosphate synthase